MLPVLDRPGSTGNLLAQLPAPRSGIARTALPMSVEEMQLRGWDEADVVFVTGDAYIDHPSFAMAKTELMATMRMTEARPTKRMLAVTSAILSNRFKSFFMATLVG